MNWFVIIPVAVIAIAFIIFLVVRNIKDEKEVEDELKNDYPKIHDEDDDIEIDEVMK